MDEDNLTKLIKHLTILLGRIPTENEVRVFIFGDEEARKMVLRGEIG